MELVCHTLATFLCECRSVIKPTDIGRFDEKISPHELRALQEKMSESDTESDFEVNMDTEGQFEWNTIISLFTCDYM